MDFRLDDDQLALQAGMRQLLERCFPRERLREAVDAQELRGVQRGGRQGDRQGVQQGVQQVVQGSQGFRGTSTGWDVGRALWRELGEAGFFSLRLPEKDGGVGLGMPEAVLLFEEAGRALVPGPLVATHLAAGLVPGAAEGTRVVTALIGPGMAEHLGAADSVLLLDGAGARVMATDGGTGPRVLDARPVQSVDPLTPLYAVQELPSPALTHLTAGGDGGRLRSEATLLTAAQQLGSALRTLDMAVLHAGTRRQFGRPIGSFQAVQHLCARMLVRAEIARSGVYAASLTMANCDIAGAKLLADEAAVRNARDCLQVHGGMGFTWDADVHLHLKRAWLRREQWRTPAAAEEELAAGLLAGHGYGAV
ncbi:acyl-CoA/acyl-ACP dehydrogenase [Streptomyces sp. ET3-23]|uniref:acyl-CoA dehydrogenase family protein n=1 Tax=Streptomyces sp. ET3-23 TaxID=2885643 RepID=UPI001D0FF89F|nr:acyl-CoA dehydrogenase family protein [Streptomyces sp. ET3-23]MCC2278294.1 acyl-CoA/acyl-ACP dehydrogenase [Streptomyces sp. ET3-23]